MKGKVDVETETSKRCWTASLRYAFYGRTSLLIRFLLAAAVYSVLPLNLSLADAVFNTARLGEAVQPYTGNTIGDAPAVVHGQQPGLHGSRFSSLWENKAVGSKDQFKLAGIENSDAFLADVYHASQLAYYVYEWDDKVAFQHELPQGHQYLDEKKIKEDLRAVLFLQQPDTLLITFRSTKTKPNMFDNLKVWADEYTFMDGRPLYVDRARKKTAQCHAGFLGNYEKIRDILNPDIVKWLQNATDNGNPIRHIKTIGHSFGGALALLSMIEYVYSKEPLMRGMKLTTYTFGMPRVLLKSTADFITREVINTGRASVYIFASKYIQGLLDPIVTVPVKPHGVVHWWFKKKGKVRAMPIEKYSKEPFKHVGRIILIEPFPFKKAKSLTGMADKDRILHGDYVIMKREDQRELPFGMLRDAMKERTRGIVMRDVTERDLKHPGLVLLFHRIPKKCHHIRDAYVHALEEMIEQQQWLKKRSNALYDQAFKHAQSKVYGIMYGTHAMMQLISDFFDGIFSQKTTQPPRATVPVDLSNAAYAL